MTRLHSSSLNAARRSAELARLVAGESVDVLVIGGGITGAGVALDAASRGLRVALVERRDLANGTSRWSSKLAHGGLRYLRQLEVGVAWESARERHILMTRTAPHLVRALPFVAALNDVMRPLHGAFTHVGIRAGDVLRAAAGTPPLLLPAPRRISAAETLRLLPAVRERDLRGGILFWDGQLEDDARLVIAVARTAAAYGARVLTYCDAVAAQPGRVTVRDSLSGQQLDIRARHVVNATGVWAQRLAPGVQLSPSKGVHVIVPASRLRNPRAALTVPVPHESARWVGATPVSDGNVIIGVTDEAYGGPVDDEPDVRVDEMRQLLDVLSLALQEPLSPDDVIGSYAGFRPLLRVDDRASSDISRRHAILDDADSGVVTVVGGKLTTYRRMAQDTVDHLLRGERRDGRTHRIPLVGAAPPAVLRTLDAPARLVRRYGAEAPLLLALGARDPSLLRPVAEGSGTLGVELLYGLQHEGALTVDDLLDRRVRLGLIPAQRAAAGPFAAALLRAAAA